MHVVASSQLGPRCGREGKAKSTRDRSNSNLDKRITHPTEKHYVDDKDEVWPRAG